MVVKLNNLIDNKTIIILKDKFKSPSHQLREIGKKLSYNGEYIFDLILLKGNISNRFIKVEFINGILNVDSMEYYYFKKCEIQKINEALIHKVNNLDNYLTNNEIESIQSLYKV